MDNILLESPRKWFRPKNICVSADHIDLNVSVYSKVIITIFGQVLLMSDPCPVKPDKYC